MHVPRTLGQTATGEVCEVDSAESASILMGKGVVLMDQDPVARKIAAYLQRQEGTAATQDTADTMADASTGEAAAPEHKAVEQEDTENKGMSFPADVRRL